MVNLTIYQFDLEYNFLQRIEAESANIISEKWKLKNVNILNQDGNFISENLDEITYESTYDLEKLKTQIITVIISIILAIKIKAIFMVKI